MKEIFESESTDQTEKIAYSLTRRLLDLHGEAGVFVALYGDLGAGKTAFVRGMASYATPGAPVCSPTYALINDYDGDKYTFYHFDMYRITDEDDLYNTGYYDYLGKKNTVIAAEWCENIPYALPDSYTKVTLEKTGADTRRITVEDVTG